MCIKKSHLHLYDTPQTHDKHYIIFEKYLPEKHDSVRKTIFSPCQEERVVKSGITWVEAGSFKPLSRPPSPDSESES